MVQITLSPETVKVAFILGDLEAMDVSDTQSRKISGALCPSISSLARTRSLAPPKLLPAAPSAWLWMVGSEQTENGTVFCLSWRCFRFHCLLFSDVVFRFKFKLFCNRSAPVVVVGQVEDHW